MSFAAVPRAAAMASQDENARLGAKAAVVDASAAARTRRAALGDISNTASAAAARRAPSASRPATAASADAPADAGVMRDISLAEPAVFDIDAADHDDPAAFACYTKEVHAWFKAQEALKSPSPRYMSSQTDINEKMRAILIDWLVEVHLKFKLMPETMYLTVNLIDRFLERKLVIRQKLQLVGVTAMLLASKYEEIYAPEVRDFVYITDKAYTREQILAMESTMLNALDFKVTVPTAFVFLNRFLKAVETQWPSPAGESPTKLSQLATYIVERCLQEYKMLTHLPSKVAAAGVNIALRTLRGSRAGLWNGVMEHYTGFTEAELRPAVLEIQEVLRVGETSSLQAVRKKYTLPRFGEVGALPIAQIE